MATKKKPAVQAIPGDDLPKEVTAVDQGPTITAGGNTYSIAGLPEDVQKLIQIYQNWEVELQAARTEVFKLEAAIRGLGIELEGRFKALTDAQ